MIEIKNNAECCGCTACFNVCQKKAIEMTADHEGFLYPVVNKQICTDCGLCEKVCPILHKAAHQEFERKSYVVRAKDREILSASTSGGFVTPLAKWVLAQKGVVFGAGFGEGHKVMHQIVRGGFFACTA